MKTLPIDHAALRQAEAEIQTIGLAVKLAVEPVLPTWRWLVLAFEFGGGALTYTASPDDLDKLAAVILREADRLETEKGGDSPTITIVPAGPVADALTPDQIRYLAGQVKSLGRLIEESLPAGWGFGLLLWSATDAGRCWCSSADREDAPALLREFVQRHAENAVARLGNLGRQS